MGQRFVKLLEYLFLGFLGEVDQNITADNHVHIRRILVLKKIVLAEAYTGLDLIGYLVGRSDLGEVFLFEIIGHVLDTLVVVKTGLCFLKDLLVNIGGRDFDLIQWNMT